MNRVSETFKVTIYAVWLSMPLLMVAQTAPLSLKRGLYVEKHEACKSAPNAATLMWNGNGFSGAHSSQCTSRVLLRDQNHVKLTTFCSALGDGSPSSSGMQSGDSFVLTRLSSTAFVMSRDQQELGSFRWCSVTLAA